MWCRDLVHSSSQCVSLHGAESFRFWTVCLFIVLMQSKPACLCLWQPLCLHLPAPPKPTRTPKQPPGNPVTTTNTEPRPRSPQRRLHSPHKLCSGSNKTIPTHVFFFPHVFLKMMWNLGDCKSNFVTPSQTHHCFLWMRAIHLCAVTNGTLRRMEVSGCLDIRF